MATKYCEIFTLLLTGTRLDKSKVKISQNFVASSEYNVWVKKTETNHISDTLLWFVSVFFDSDVMNFTTMIFLF